MERGKENEKWINIYRERMNFRTCVSVYTCYVSSIGPKVISKSIPLSSIKELSSVLQRPPVLWDNLHANDYDQRRLFLGPYCGRSVMLHQHLNGVLTNPNCEYTANYVAIHTLAQWNRSAAELVKRPLSSRQSFQLEVEGQPNELSESDEVTEGPSSLTGEGSTCSGDATTEAKRVCPDLEVHLYEPGKALEMALKEWIHEFSVAVQQPDCYQPVKNASSIAKANEFEELGGMDQEDVCSSEDSASKPVVPECDPKLAELDDQAALVSSEPFTGEDLKILVDFFYLPHQHGDRALKILEEFQWLKENAPGLTLSFFPSLSPSLPFSFIFLSLFPFLPFSFSLSSSLPPSIFLSFPFSLPLSFFFLSHSPLFFEVHCICIHVYTYRCTYNVYVPTYIYMFICVCVRVHVHVHVCF